MNKYHNKMNGAELNSALQEFRKEVKESTEFKHNEQAEYIRRYNDWRGISANEDTETYSTELNGSQLNAVLNKFRKEVKETGNYKGREQFEYINRFRVWRGLEPIEADTTEDLGQPMVERQYKLEDKEWVEWQKKLEELKVEEAADNQSELVLPQPIEPSDQPTQLTGITEAAIEEKEAEEETVKPKRRKRKLP